MFCLLDLVNSLAARRRAAIRADAERRADNYAVE
jgi:hypothetical protein